MTDSPVELRSPVAAEAIVSYSQNAEDVRLWRVFADVEKGFYVDVGAGDPTIGSVTRLFYDHGWSGINIEPAPPFAALNDARIRDVNIRAAVGASEGTVAFSLTYPDLGMSTLDIAAHAHVPETIERVVEVSVPQHRLETILREHAEGRTIHFLKVDVEGAEGEVLASSDWDAFRPMVVIVEAIESWTASPAHEGWEDILGEADYALAAFDGINRFYVDRAHAQLIPALAYPISALDRYVPAELHAVHEELRAREDELEKVRREASRLQTDIRRLQAELAGVYNSPMWQVGTRLVRAANPLAPAVTRLRRLKSVPPTRAYAAAVAPRQDWHFPRGGPAVSDRKFGSLIGLFGPNDAAVSPVRGAEIAGELRRIGWLNEDSLLRRTLSWAERQALLEADAVVRLCGRGDQPVPGPSSEPGAESIVVVDVRCLQDPAYLHRGVGLHGRSVLNATRLAAGARPVVLLTTAELPRLDDDIAGTADRVISTPYEVRDEDVSLFVQLSPMTASATPAVPFLAAENCSTATVVYDFIPSAFPRAYLRSAPALLENRVRIEALRHYDLLLPISAATAAECRRILGERAEVRVSGVSDPLEGATSVPVAAKQPFMLVPIGGDARKNAAAAVAALAEHRKADVGDGQLHAVITGTLTGPQAAALQTLTRRVGLPEDAVDLKGSVTNDELGTLYRSAELVLVPSIAEGFSIPVAEALLRRTPVVVSDIPAHRELVGTGPWLADPADVEALAEAVAHVRLNRARVFEQQRKALGDTSDPAGVTQRLADAVNHLLRRPRPEARRRVRSGSRPRLAVVSPFPPQRSGVADYTAFTFGQIAKHADVEVYAQTQNGSPALQVHPLSAEPYLDGRFDAVVNVVGNSHFHFGVLDLMGSYGGACIAHDNRMVEAYDYDRGAAWTAQLISTPAQTVRPEQLPELIHDLDRLPAAGYDIIAQQASPLIVHGRALADAIFDETGVRPVVVPFVPYNVPSRDVIEDAARREARETLGLTDDVLHVATFGVVDRRTKGNGLIVAAVPWLLSWGIPTRLHIVGDSPGTESRALRRLAADLDVAGDIVMHGHVARRTLEQFLIGIDVAVQLRTSARLSLSGGVLDCFAFGVPTVTTENVAHELDAPSYVTTTPAVTSSLLVAEAVAGLRDRRRSATTEIEVERCDYLRARSVEGYAQAVLAALELGST